MSHPLNIQFWYGWPAVLFVVFAVFGVLGTAGEMSVGEQLVGAVGGGFILVTLYWALWRIIPGRSA